MRSTAFDIDVGPANPRHFAEWIDVDIEGHLDERIYADHFRVRVCTIAWLGATERRNRSFWGRGYFLTESWDVETLKRSLELVCEEAKAPSWNAVVAVLSRYLLVESVDSAPV